MAVPSGLSEKNKVAVKGRRGDQGEAASLNGRIFGLIGLLGIETSNRMPRF